MKLPDDVVIPTEKLTEYLLVWRARNDKSVFLARAGYTAANWRLLESDIRKLVRASDAEPDGLNDFGEFFVVRGKLVGPNNSTLKAKTVWIQLSETDEIRFVTLVPDQE